MPKYARCGIQLQQALVAAGKAEAVLRVSMTEYSIDRQEADLESGDPVSDLESFELQAQRYIDQAENYFEEYERCHGKTRSTAHAHERLTKAAEFRATKDGNRANAAGDLLAFNLRASKLRRC